MASSDVFMEPVQSHDLPQDQLRGQSQEPNHKSELATRSPRSKTRYIPNKHVSGLQPVQLIAALAMAQDPCLRAKDPSRGRNYGRAVTAEAHHRRYRGARLVSYAYDMTRWAPKKTPAPLHETGRDPLGVGKSRPELGARWPKGTAPASCGALARLSTPGSEGRPPGGSEPLAQTHE